MPDCNCVCRVATVECVFRNSTLPLATIALQGDGFWNNFQDLYLKGYKDSEDYPLLLGEACYNEFCEALNNLPLPTVWQTLYDSKEFRLYVGTAFEYYWKRQNTGISWTVEGANKDSENAVSQHQIEAQLSNIKQILLTRRVRLMEYIKTLALPCLGTCEATECDPCERNKPNKRMNTTSRF